MALAAGLLGVAAALGAQHALEIITLRHRTAEQVLPALRPLLEPGATLSGQSNQLFVRASPANLADLRLALEALDRPLRRLQISVRFEGEREAGRGRIEASGSIGNRGSHLELKAEESRLRREERVDQRIQVMEGGRAVVYSARSRPQRQLIQTPGGVVSQPIVVVHDRATGFEVVPRLSGSTVFLDIGGATLTAGLGQWIELGRSSSAATYRSELQQVWLKVEELRD